MPHEEIPAQHRYSRNNGYRLKTLRGPKFRILSHSDFILSPDTPSILGSYCMWQGAHVDRHVRADRYAIRQAAPTSNIVSPPQLPTRGPQEHSSARLFSIFKRASHEGRKYLAAEMLAYGSTAAGPLEAPSNPRFIPLAYDPDDAENSVLRLVYTLFPEWEDMVGRVEFKQLTEGKTNLVG